LAKDLVKKMLEIDPEVRPPALALIDHPWFKEKTMIKIPLLALQRIAKAQNAQEYKHSFSNTISQTQV
jgi:serine/threonine protein kinase